MTTYRLLVLAALAACAHTTVSAQAAPFKAQTKLFAKGAWASESERGVCPIFSAGFGSQSSANGSVGFRERTSAAPVYRIEKQQTDRAAAYTLVGVKPDVEALTSNGGSYAVVRGLKPTLPSADVRSLMPTLQSDPAYYFEDGVQPAADGSERKATNGHVEYRESEDGQVAVSGCAGLDGTITGTRTGDTFTFHPQTYTTIKTEGGKTSTVTFVQLDVSKHQFSADPAAVISGSRDATTGIITIHNAGFIITESDDPSLVGNGFAFLRLEYRPANALMTTYRCSTLDPSTDVKTVYPLIVRQTMDNEAEIYNFSDNLETITAELYAGGKIQIAPQQAFYNTTYGPFYFFPAADGYTASANSKEDYITATAEASTATLGAWGVYSIWGQQAQQFNRFSEITWPEGAVSFPEPLPADWQGSGTADSPYLISSPRQLMALGEKVNGGEACSGQHFALDADLDFAGETRAYRTIGYNPSYPFAGTLDGLGHTISNLVRRQGRLRNQGLFGYLPATAALKNIKLSGSGLLTHGRASGLLAGYSCGTVSGCSASGCELLTESAIAGGLVGASDGGTVADCSFSGIVQGAGALGGVVGFADGGSVSGCSAAGEVDMTAYDGSGNYGVGGVVGQAADCRLAGLVNTAALQDAVARAYLGGVVGQTYLAGLSESLNVGPLLSAAAIESDGQGGTLSRGAAGGLVGVSYAASASDCMNAGLVSCPNSVSRVGGLVGNVIKGATTEAPSSFSGCLNAGQVYLPQGIADATASTPAYGLYGSAPESSTFEGCLYDIQLTGYPQPLGDKLPPYAAYTSDLVSVLPAGFSADKWQRTTACYPALKRLSRTKAMQTAIAPVTFADRQTYDKVSSDFQLGTRSGVEWRAVNSEGQLTTETDGFRIEDGRAILAGRNASEMLVASNDGFQTVKTVYVKTVNAGAFRGSGTEADPYLISSPADLDALNDGLLSHNQTYKGDHFRLTADIDLQSAAGFEGIGDATHKFAGEFDGAGFAIHHLVIDRVATAADGTPAAKGSVQGRGFFGALAPTAVVKRLTIASDCRIRGWSNMGGLAGTVEGRIEDCRNEAQVEAVSTYAGGICAAALQGSAVQACHNAGAVKADKSYAAGICAVLRGGRLLTCQNDGTVAASSYASGICAYVLPQEGKTKSDSGIIACLNAGNITADAGAAGICGLTPFGLTTTVSHCVNCGPVRLADINSGSRSVGAIFADAPQAADIVEANYYDCQQTPYGAAASCGERGCTGLPTSSMTAGNAPEGLDASAYDFAAGAYPVIRGFAGLPSASALRVAFVTPSGHDTADELTAAAGLSAAEGLVWSVSGDSCFRIEHPSEGAAEAARLLVDTPSGTRPATALLTATIGEFARTWLLRAMPRLFDGEGTEDSPYLISSKEDMAKLAEATTTLRARFAGRHFRLTADLDYASTAPKTIAATPAVFDAEFDGGGHTIEGVKTTASGPAALFGTIGTEGFLHDLTLKGSVTSNATVAGFCANLYGRIAGCRNCATIRTTDSGPAAGLAAYVRGTASIESCENRGEVFAPQNWTGGLAGYMYRGSRVANSDNFADISGGAGYTGGIAGASQATVADCQNHGYVAGGQHTGGIVGYTAGRDSTYSCTNLGDVYSTDSNAGGIIGSGSRSDSGSVIADCRNEADITAVNGYAGGLIGYSNGSITISRSSNSGHVTAKTGPAGGLAGAMTGQGDWPAKIEYSFNEGRVDGDEDVGGIGGTLYYHDDNPASMTVARCHNTGAVSGFRLVGGVAGAGYALLDNVFNSGAVTSSTHSAAGLIACAGGLFRQSANFGSITAKSNSGNEGGTYGGAAGFAAYSPVSPGLTLEDCCNTGHITAADYAAGFDVHAYGAYSSLRCYNAGLITLTRGTHSAHTLYTFESASSGPAVSQTVYNAELNPQLAPSEYDLEAEPLTASQLSQWQPAEWWIVSGESYPQAIDTDGTTDSRAALIAAGLAIAQGSGIADVKADNRESLSQKACDLGGRPVTAASHGLIIVKGKKIVR